jgi:hypothetical protein
MNLLDLMKRVSKINLRENTGPKKKLVMRFIEGNLKGKQIQLDPEEMPIIFGKCDPNQEAGQKKDFLQLEGTKICN